MYFPPTIKERYDAWGLPMGCTDLHQKVAASLDEISPVDMTKSQDSPPYTPSPSECERQVLSSYLKAELRVACAILVKQTCPTAPDPDDLPNYNETLNRLNEEYEKVERSRRARKLEHQAVSSLRHRDVTIEANTNSAPYVHIPRNAAASFEATAGHRKLSTNLSANAKTAPSANKSSSHKGLDQQLSKFRDVDPKTLAAACADYTGPSVDTSSSTSRSTTTYEGFARGTSTGLSSLALTPGNDKRASITNQRVSEQILQDGPAASLADASARAWMAEELSRRRTGSKSRQSTNSAIRTSVQKDIPNLGQPVSRAGSIAVSMAGSVKDGIKEYVRPRVSTDGMHSNRPAIELTSRTGSRDSSDSKGNASNWWRNSEVKRKSSWSSFRSNRLEKDEMDPSVQDGAPNLNRELPALPGLDLYKEKRVTPTHIAHLMRVSRKGEAKKPKEEAPFVPEESYKEFFAPTDRKGQQEASREAVEVKTQHDALMASAKFGLYPQQKPRAKFPDREADPAAPSPRSVPAVENSKTPDKKLGLRKRLIRFWNHGSAKARVDACKNSRNMAAAH